MTRKDISATFGAAHERRGVKKFEEIGYASDTDWGVSTFPREGLLNAPRYLKDSLGLQ